MNIARTDDNFKSIVSYSTPAKGRKLYAKKNYAPNHKWNQLDYQNGDLNTSIIKTHMGRTIMIQWDETMKGHGNGKQDQAIGFLNS